MNLNTDIKTLTDVIGGSLRKGAPRTPFNSFETDTRKLHGGEFFWALKGAAYDAHDFLTQELASKTRGWIISDAAAELLTNTPEIVISAPDTYTALHKLSAWHRGRFNIPLAAITGSNGKSTTKEMLRAIYGGAGEVCCNSGNFNNQFGLPFSLLELSANHQFAVFELGASKKGDILEIGALARPTIAVITNIGPSHLQYFGDLDTVFKTKTELVDCLSPDGTLVYNLDDKYLSALRDRNVKKLSFGYSDQADIRIAEKRPGLLSLSYRDQTVDVHLPLSAPHNYLNAAAAAGAAIASGLDFASIKAGLENFAPPPMRMQTMKLFGSTVILDAYNANPASMKAALSALTTSDLKKPYYLALGDMKELGKYSRQYHAELGEQLKNIGAEKIFLAGPEMKAAAEVLASGSKPDFVYSEVPSSWATELRGLIKNGSGTFLLKASRAMKFETLLEGL